MVAWCCTSTVHTFWLCMYVGAYRCHSACVLYTQLGWSHYAESRTHTHANLPTFGFGTTPPSAFIRTILHPSIHPTVRIKWNEYVFLWAQLEGDTTTHAATQGVDNGITHTQTPFVLSIECYVYTLRHDTLVEKTGTTLLTMWRRTKKNILVRQVCVVLIQSELKSKTSGSVFGIILLVRPIWSIALTS